MIGDNLWTTGGRPGTTFEMGKGPQNPACGDRVFPYDAPHLF